MIEIMSFMDMHPAFAGAALAAACAGAYAVIRKKYTRALSFNELAALEAKHGAEHGFFPKKLMTPNEIHFYRRLQQAAGVDFVVLTQVGLGALVDTTLPEGHPLRDLERRKFVGKLIDFVFLNARTLDVAFVVELDDRTHDSLKDSHRDHFLLQSGIPTLRYESRCKPSVQELLNDFKRIDSKMP